MVIISLSLIPQCLARRSRYAAKVPLLALDNCAILDRLFVNNGRVKKIAICFRIFDLSTHGR